MSMLKIHKNDEVVVIDGKDNGKRGKVQKVLDNDKLLVAAINMVKKHQKPNPYLQQPGGIIDKEARIQVSTLLFGILRLKKLTVLALRLKVRLRCVFSNPLAKTLTPDRGWKQICHV